MNKVEHTFFSVPKLSVVLLDYIFFSYSIYHEIDWQTIKYLQCVFSRTRSKRTTEKKRKSKSKETRYYWIKTNGSQRVHCWAYISALPSGKRFSLSSDLLHYGQIGWLWTQLFKNPSICKVVLFVVNKVLESFVPFVEIEIWIPLKMVSCPIYFIVTFTVNWIRR